MKIITLNVNGIRSAAKYGFYEWLEEQQPDIICLQEVKAHLHQLPDNPFHPKNYFCYYACAEKKGYSGVAIYSKLSPQNVQVGMGIPEFDVEGRYLRLDFPDFSVISLYLPSGTSGEHRQTFKYQTLDWLWNHLQDLKQQLPAFIIAGDLNIAHKAIDLKNWRANQKNTGFLPEERAWLDQLFEPNQFIDVFRVLNKEPEQYTWWSHRGQAYAKNVGWRIDYQVATPNLESRIQRVWIDKSKKFSDHAPLGVEYG